MAGQTPGAPGSPGREKETSTMPPCKQAFSHDCTEPEAYREARKPVFVV